MYELTKRALDLGAAAVGLVLLGPVLLLVAGAAWLGGLRPVVFRQWRTGYREQPFQLLKFCTMTQARDAAGQLLPDGQRLTGLGRWLRRTSLYELPQLCNVLRGELSLVGPRPFIHQYLPLYSAAQKQRFRVRPGLTGWAQVNGRNAISWEEKFAYDLWYIEHRSLGLDLRILWRTAGRVLGRRDIAAAGEATMPAFTGSGAPE